MRFNGLGAGVSQRDVQEQQPTWQGAKVSLVRKLAYEASSPGAKHQELDLPPLLSLKAHGFYPTPQDKPRFKGTNVLLNSLS